MANEVNPIKSKRDFNKLKNALKPGRDRLLLQLGTAFGLRISDLLSLKVGDLRGQTSLKITEAKRGKTRVITFSASVKKLVNELEGADEDYVFASRKGANPISRVQAYRILNEAAERAEIAQKIGNIGTHTLRKTFGYRLYEMNIAVDRIAAILGHSSEKDTLKYIGITADEISVAYESIAI